MNRRDELYRRVIGSTSPHAKELERLLDQRHAGFLTDRDYERDRNAVLNAFEREAVR